LSTRRTPSTYETAGGGGGHRQAAVFTTSLAADELVAFLRAELAAQLTPAVS
jgi:phosphoesterase RecJ-like protein